MSEKIIKADAWDKLCEKCGAKPITTGIRFNGERFEEDPNKRVFKIACCVVLDRVGFLLNPEAALDVMEQEFVNQIQTAIRNLREETERLR